MDSNLDGEFPTVGCRWNSMKTVNPLNWNTKWNYWELKNPLTILWSFAPLKVVTDRIVQSLELK